MLFRTCDNCGANIDPGEVCDCKKAAPGVTSTQSGKSGKGYQTFNSAPTVADKGGKSNGATLWCCPQCGRKIQQFSNSMYWDAGLFMCEDCRSEPGREIEAYG